MNTKTAVVAAFAALCLLAAIPSASAAPEVPLPGTACSGKLDEYVLCTAFEALDQVETTCHANLRNCPL